MKHPEIRIEANRFLQPVFSAAWKAQNPDWEEPQPEHARKKADDFAAQWNPIEKEILALMCEIAGLEFFQNAIDVYIVEGYRGGFSNPMVISANVPNFNATLTHELFHRLTADNTLKINLHKVGETLYPEVADFRACNHIHIHALHKELYLRRGDHEGLAEDIGKCQKHPSYKHAWEIVEKEGHLDIIAKYKACYPKK